MDIIWLYYIYDIYMIYMICIFTSEWGFNNHEPCHRETVGFFGKSQPKFHANQYASMRLVYGNQDYRKRTYGKIWEHHL